MPVALQVLLTAALSVPFSLLSGWDVVTSARLNAQLKAIRDAGDPITMTDLAKTYPEPLPGRNAAIFYNEAFQRMEAQPELPENRLRLLPIVGTAQLPPTDRDVPPAMVRAVRDYLKDNAEILDLLRNATALDECKFEIDFTKGPGMLLPHLAKLRQAARLLALEAVERTEGGKPDEAADSLVACLRCGQAVRREPILISYLVRVACDAIAFDQVERWASRAKPSPKALERVEAAVAAATDHKGLERAMAGERCFGIDIYQNYVLKPNRGALLGALGVGADPAGMAVLGVIPQAYFKTDMLYYLDIMNRYVAAARMPYPEALQAGTQVGRNLDQEIPKYYFVSRMILPALSRVFFTAQRHLAQGECALLGLAALRYRDKHGRLPDALQALVPDFAPTVPPDPFDGKPLRYRKDGDGLVLYTVGENGKDDGGDTARREGKQPDIGFRVRWPKAQF